MSAVRRADGGRPRRAPVSGWSVRAHLIAIVVAVLVVFACVGVTSAWQVLDSARDDTRASARHAAGVAANAVEGNIELGQAQASAVAGNPAVLALLEDPTACELAFSLELLPRSRLDIIGADGALACSSSPAAEDAEPHVGATWLAELAPSTGVVQGGVGVDRVSGRAVTFAAPVRGPAGDVRGAVVFVAPTAELASRLTETYGERRRYDFAVIDGSGLLLTAPDGITGAGGGSEPLADAGHLTGSDRIPELRWRVEAGLPSSIALESTRAVLSRGALVGAGMLIVLLAALAVVNRRIARPLRRLTSAVSSRGSRVDEVADSLRGPSEVLLLAEELRSAMAAHEAYETQLSHQALHDPLTGLPNRALLGERLTHSLEQAKRTGRLVTVLFLDFDRFKVVNDSLGHAVGDRVLIAAATRLRELLRPGDTLARFGGDEFVIVGEAFTDLSEAQRFAERLLAAVDVPIEIDGRIVRLSASVGIAMGTADSMANDLVRDADTAMYVAKDGGRARLAVFDGAIRDRVTERLTIETELRGAIAREELRLVYQPKVDLRDGTAIGVEALIRWEHPALGTVPPATFIPVAEETGSMVALGEFVLREACRQGAEWRDVGLDVTVAVNVSGRQLAEPGFPAAIAGALDAFRLQPDRLCLELTESLLLTDAVRVARMLDELRDLGVRISVDDFGAGYPSLGYLHRFPIDEIKIDQVFIHALASHADQRTLVTSMIAMGHALGLDIVAEGVETLDQADTLRHLGCRIAQGNLFAAPQAATTLLPLLKHPSLAPKSSAAPAAHMDREPTPSSGCSPGSCAARGGRTSPPTPGTS